MSDRSHFLVRDITFKLQVVLTKKLCRKIDFFYGYHFFDKTYSYSVNYWPILGQLRHSL